MRAAWEILSCIYADLSEQERKAAEQTLGEPLKKDFRAGPAIEHGKGGWVSPKAPVSIETLSEMSVADIVDKLKSEWCPSHLHELDTDRDFLNPLNADGMGRLLKADLSTRPAAYIVRARLFLSPEALHTHYTYSFLSGVSEALRYKKSFECVDWSPFIQLMIAIVERSREGLPEQGSEHDRGDTWLAGWDGVLRAMGNVVEELLKNNNIGPVLAARYRAELICIICLLLANPDPTAEYERQTRNNAFSIAINSIRGQALQVFLQFIYRDASLTEGSAPSLVAGDAREIYATALNAETTMAVRFLFGYYLFFMHLKDRNWMEGLLPVLFPADAMKKDLYLATWEGYLTNQLNLDIFLVLREYYRRAILLNSAYYTRREYHTELDVGLARHMALAFVHIDDFRLNDDLLQLFWRTPNVERHREFISLIGRHAILREENDEAGDYDVDVLHQVSPLKIALPDCVAVNGGPLQFRAFPRADDTRWHASYLREVWNILGHHRPSAYDGSLPDTDAGEHNGIHSDIRPSADPDGSDHKVRLNDWYVSRYSRVLRAEYFRSRPPSYVFSNYEFAGVEIALGADPGS